MLTVEPLGQKLRHFRRSIGLTQLELALAAGVSERTVRSAERGRPIRRDFLDYLATAIGIDVRELARDPAAVASLVTWRRNLAAVNDAISRIVLHSDMGQMLELAHPNMDVRMHLDGLPSFGGMRQDFDREFAGHGEVHRFFDLVEEFNSRVIERQTPFHAPIGDGNCVFLRGYDLLTFQSGERALGWWIHKFEFEDQRVVHCTEYLGELPHDVAKFHFDWQT